jgi:hypothetical protein
MIYFSPTTVAFYDSDLHAAFPADSKAIDTERYRALLCAQEAGQCIAADDNGNPISLDPPAPSGNDGLALLRAERDRRLAASDFSQLADVPMSATQRTAWCVYRQALRDLPETITDLAAVTWPQAPL